MRRAVRTAFLVLILASSSVFLARVQKPPDPQKTWALIIGVSNYTHAEPLRFAATDSLSFQSFLESPRGGSIPREHIVSLVEDEATRTSIMVALESLQEKVKEGDTVFVYIAGHGYTKGRIGYFIPADGNLASPSASAVHFTALKEMIESGLAQAKVRVLITDICNAGRIGPENSALGEKIQNLINDELARVDAGAGSFLNLLASRGTEPSWEREDLGGGVFTQTLLQALNGKGAAEGATVASAKDVVDFVRSEVPKYTGKQQNPMANAGFPADLPLAFLKEDPPQPRKDVDATSLVIQNVNRVTYSRVEWKDPRTQSKAVRQLPKDRERVQIAFLTPGELQLQFFDKDDMAHPVRLNLERGQNTLDVGRATFRFTPAGPVRLAALAPAAVPQQAPAVAADTESNLVIRLAGVAEAYVDDVYFGRSEAAQPLLRLTGLAVGIHTVRLVPSPDREYRFRVKLFAGEHILDLTSGELRFVLEPRPPSRTSAPTGLPAALDATYQSFVQALWEERMVQPTGNSAWDFYLQLRDRVPAAVRREIENRLATAFGDRAQRTILKYLRGGDIRWSAEPFDEGNELLDRTEQLLRVMPAIETQRFFFQGRALVERGQYTQAIDRLRQATALDPEASHAFNAMGLAYWKQNQLTQAITPLQQAIALTPQWNYPRVTLSLVLMEQRRYDEAERSFRDAIQTNGEDSTAYHGLAQLQLLRGQFDEAQTLLDRALEFNPGNAYAYETLGRLRRSTGRRTEAEQFFRLAVRLEPDELSFQVNLASLLKDVGQIPGAQAMFAAAANRSPSNIQLVQAYSALLVEQKQPQQAQAVFDKALKASPKDANLHVLYGGFLSKQQRPKDAEKSYKNAIKLDARNTFAHHDLALLYLSQKKLKDAEREVALSIEADARFAPPHRLLGQVRAAQGKRGEAMDAFRKALSLAVEPEQRQEITEAIAELERGETRDALGAARNTAAEGNYKDAWSRYGTALKAAPEDAALRNAVVELYDSHPDLDLKKVPVPAITDVLKSAFWKARLDAERRWQKGDKADAVSVFATALQKLTTAERRVIASTAFNLQNERFSIHQILFIWAQRLIEEKNYTEANRLMEAALDRKIFGVVPNFSPRTIDSLMTPSDIADPKEFSDFEIALHPDRRAHSIFAALAAAAGDMTGATAYLSPLESSAVNVEARLLVARTLRQERKWSEAATVLKDALSTAPAFVLLGEVQCAAGDCAAGRATIELGLQRFPNDAELRSALGRIR